MKNTCAVLPRSSAFFFGSESALVHVKEILKVIKELWLFSAWG
jgi:hypothetical protein